MGLEKGQISKRGRKNLVVCTPLVSTSLVPLLIVFFYVNIEKGASIFFGNIQFHLDQSLEI